MDHSTGYRMGAIPEDLASAEATTLTVDGATSAALTAAVELIGSDERFEYMTETDLDAALWRFVCKAAIDRGPHHVPAFVTEHARTPGDHTCYFTIEHLSVPEERELYGVRFLPADTSDKPENPLFPPPDDASVIAVPCHGTGHAAMTARARTHAEHALRILRATLRDHPGIHDRQLRFRLGENHWMDDRPGGWAVADDKGWELSLHESFIPYATEPKLVSLPHDPRNDVERRSNRALVWLEHAQLATDSLVRTLSLFYALETLLGDGDGGQKGPRLAARRATLGAATTEHFQHPVKVIVFYDEVRSAAVHGDEPMPLPENEISSLAWSVRTGISEYLTYAAERNLTRRSQVVAALEQDEQWAQIVDRFIAPNPEWLRHLNPPS